MGMFVKAWSGRKLPFVEIKSIILVPIAHPHRAGMLFFVVLCSPKSGRKRDWVGSIRFDLQFRREK